MSYIKTNIYYCGIGGHFLIIKGYKVFDNEVYFEIYDPAFGMQTYANGSLAGKGRFYLAREVIAVINAPLIS